MFILHINVQTDIKLFSKNQGRFPAPDRIAQLSGRHITGTVVMDIVRGQSGQVYVISSNPLSSAKKQWM